MQMKGAFVVFSAIMAIVLRPALCFGPPALRSPSRPPPRPSPRQHRSAAAVPPWPPAGAEYGVNDPKRRPTPPTRRERGDLSTASVILPALAVSGAALWLCPAVADAASSLADSSSVLLSAVPAWLRPTKVALDVFLLAFTLLFFFRLVMSWYPSLKLKELPWIAVIVATEPVLKPTRELVPPAFGVDISPVVWLGITSLARELLISSTGLLTMIENKG
ncbi:unnamed protein product [Vitrella brassicaformis CCMP3155]|uniref:YggT family protein n=1 Tax=Vitrella brassicaformis (strain CCMP3155) TaxID=1169540 RepID=A0A0G4H0L3_VITBC|nr:unnamed protein product [Vitrella brassicaformis CCMP3155]|mmetsp:Transcript_7014/g.17049  ORF Transcript_7014/g.17049 Transcript_7014/m.17049 type:complete len:219 (-) Transcript_7014:355-1011(-)|eukprot:CEM37059.1 unnamed protein product [Vitrella brassicaformis CCMP3155]